MSDVRSARNRSTEWKLRAAFIRRGVRGWKITVRELPGNPDFVFPKSRLIGKGVSSVKGSVLEIDT